MELNPTSYVILGMLGLKPMCGYEIKQLVDNSTRFFWAASYGQIYPELRRLSEKGLIEGRPDSGTARGRIEFELTDEGRRTLERWLAEPPEIQEMRDESMLKVFFSGTAGNGGTRAALEAKRDHHRENAARLRDIEEGAQATDASGGPMTALRLGIAFNDFVADWCEREADAA
jgi:DNA-binding PadR family transcriptional regulator